jgi:hypothetical protein
MKEETQQSQKNTGSHGGGAFTSVGKRALERRMASKHLQRQRKPGQTGQKRLANPGDGRIITKTAKNSSFTP